MLLTITPNLCVERTVVIDGFGPGQVHRVPPERLQVNAGGKGINAARVAARMGCDVLATGWVGQHQQGWFAAQLAREGVPQDLVPVTADTRICTSILDGRGGKTEIVEAGMPLESGDGTRLLEKLDALLPRAALVAVGGSYPPSRTGAAFDTHLTLLASLAHQHGRRIIVDSKGGPFEMLLRGGQPPWCIKPNLDEAATVLHRSIDGEAAERRAVGDLVGMGVQVVLLSCGARGAYLGAAEGVYFFHAPKVREVSPVGSGDAMVGAFAAKYLETRDLQEATRWGVAAGAASAAQTLSAFCDQADIDALLPQVRVETVP